MDLETTVHLKESEVKNIIKEYFKIKGYDVIGEPQIILSDVSEGYLMNERTVTKFKEIECKVNMNSKRGTK